MEQPILPSLQTESVDYVGPAEWLRVIAHPVRIQLLLYLIEKGSQNVTTLYQHLDMPQSTISQHLGKLKAAQIVIAKRAGLEMYYEVQSPQVHSLLSALFPTV